MLTHSVEYNNSISHEIARQYSPHEIDSAIEEYWEEVDAYEQTVAAHEDDSSFYFLDGPPYATDTSW